MGVFDKFLDAIKLNDDYDDDEFFDDDDLLEDDFDEEEEAEEKPRKKFFDKFGKKKDDVDDFEDDFEEEPVKPARKVSVESKAAAAKPAAKTTSKPARTQSSKITPMRGSKRGSQAMNTEVCVIKPSSMEDTREIADTLLDNATVILNLEGIDVELAQRIIDFTSGACYSLGGSLQKVSSSIFILGPYNVDITGDLQNILSGSVPSIRSGC